MDSVLSFVNRLVNHLFQMFLTTFWSLSPVWPLIVVSLLTAFLMLWIYGRISAQGEIRAVKNRIRGNLLGVRLFQHDIGVVLRLQAGILKDTGMYLRHSLLPVFVIIIPVLLILVQLNLYFSVVPLRPGTTTLLEARLQGDVSGSDYDARVEVPEGVEVETPPVRMPHAVAWRILGRDAGRYTLTVRVDGSSTEKELLVGESWQAVSPLKTGSVLDHFLYPGEPRIGSPNQIASVRIRYESLAIRVLGLEIHWLVLFFVLSVLFSFALKGIFGVEL